MNWKRYTSDVDQALAMIEENDLYAFSSAIWATWKRRATVFTCGNGGSADNANHLAQDLSKGTMVNGTKPLKALSLCNSVSFLTAVANDDRYEDVFLAQLRTYGEPGDLLIAISGSGNSQNVLKAVGCARQLGMPSWGICGFDGGKLKQNATASVHVPCHDMGMVEAAHGVIFHWLVSYLRERAEHKEG